MSPVRPVRLVLVRHGRPDGTWGQDPDPGLDALGHEQARAAAAELAPLGPLPVVVSPLRRTRETAQPILERWGIEPVIEPGIGELTAPADPQPDHATWLRTLMRGPGADHPSVIDPFRRRVLGAIRAISTDTVVVTHFLAINAVVGAATNDDRVVCFAPAHCSHTVLSMVNGTLTVVELGVQGNGTDGAARL